MLINNSLIFKKGEYEGTYYIILNMGKYQTPLPESYFVRGQSPEGYFPKESQMKQRLH